MNEVGAVLVWCPFPNRAKAREVSNALLDQKLIACANIVGDIEVIYEWNDSRCNENEVGVLFKTTDAICDEMIQKLGDYHPYDTPAIIGWRCDNSHPSTRAWLIEQTLSEEG
ncbi:divalent-cation tolerance protein CutA [Erythrobacter sp. F6033]|uniref:divalent-cation tolerance protein CutA n=1 Tax=Erythrobacter sp. F6033 TaxID=2926401 RepID=UPI001FF5132F|nr:divalent-cation tolerance protein CutA [Erythrobacter sp. F6033]MCK0129714.1 divalent-cation tolerance protein CutA [Erythrobacter sp. F6033]